MVVEESPKLSNSDDPNLQVDVEHLNERSTPVKVSSSLYLFNEYVKIVKGTPAYLQISSYS